MPLCKVCQKIDIRALVTSRTQLPDDLWKTPRCFRTRAKLEIHQPQTQMLHSSFLQAREKSAECELCALVWKEFLNTARLSYMHRNFSTASDEDIAKYFLREFDDHEMWIQVHDTQNGTYLCASCGSPGNIYLSVELEIYIPTEDTPISDCENSECVGPPVLQNKEIYRYPESQACLSLAKSWLQTCIENHRCGRSIRIAPNATTNPPILPTRVIDVGDASKSPSLYVSRGERGHWVALSYCWGGNSDFVLTQKSYQVLITGQPLDEFPATLRDAIIVTRALGVRFLWIDALCIFQDSSSDWDSEAPKMIDIYSKGLVTIIAAASDSVDAGIFHERTPGLSCKLPWTSSQAIGDMGRKCTCATRYIGIRLDTQDKLGWKPNNGNSRWVTRAWTMQEHLLSLRTLTYTSTQMIWECLSCARWENGKRDKSLLGGRYPLHLIQKHLGWWSLNALHIQKDIWYEMVRSFSQRSLTRGSDKFLAIAGLAKVLQPFFVDDYCAGLWRKDIVFGLLWMADNIIIEGGGRFFSEGPSWSWTSLACPVNYNDDILSRPPHLGLGNGFFELSRIENLAMTY